MSGWANKRFWTDTTVEAVDGGYGVLLDGRGVKTPGKSALVVPTARMAEAVAAEFAAQDEVVDPTTMPWTRSANSAIEKVATQRAEVEAHLIGYAGTDLLCYRADGPGGLVARQADGWDPILDWVAERYDARLRTTSGVMPTSQDAAALERLALTMQPMSDFAMTGFHDMVTLTGSYALGLAIAAERLEPDAAWTLSRIDEEWQIEQWGEDDEAREVAGIKRTALLHATEFFRAA